jgi:hypothetical protein
MRFEASKLRPYRNLKEAERDFYSSRQLEVRAGIIHALSREQLLTYGFDEFPVDGKIRFFLKVYRENMAEVMRQYHTIGKGRHPTTTSIDILYMAERCLIFPLSEYCKQRVGQHNKHEPIDDIAEELLLLLTDWKSGIHHLSVRLEPLKSKIGRFLEAYKRNDGTGIQPTTWFQLAIHSENFNLLDAEKSAEKIEKQLLTYIRKSNEWEDEDQKAIPLTLSNLMAHRGSHAYQVAKYLIGCMSCRGAFDDLDQINEALTISQGQGEKQ